MNELTVTRGEVEGNNGGKRGVGLSRNMYKGQTHGQIQMGIGSRVGGRDG